MKSTPYCAVLPSLLFLVAVPFARADFTFDRAGLRGGVDSESDADFSSVEVFGNIDTPWEWALGGSATLDLDLEASVGLLHGEGDTGFYCSVGPVAAFSFADFPLVLVIGSGPALYTEDEYDDFDLGGNFHFITRAGIDWDLNGEWTLGYRFQHTSNADLADPNPGLDMHTLGLSLRF